MAHILREFSSRTSACMFDFRCQTVDARCEEVSESLSSFVVDDEHWRNFVVEEHAYRSTLPQLDSTIALCLMRRPTRNAHNAVSGLDGRVLLGGQVAFVRGNAELVGPRLNREELVR